MTAALPILTDLSALAAGLPETGRLLALDVGAKTVGIAVSDPGRRIASPDHVLRRRKFTRDAEAIATTANARGAAALVIGLPINMDGSHGRRAQSVRDFAQNLAARADLFASRPALMLFDERLSTAAAEDAMSAAGLSRGQQAERVDKLAAAWFLQALLDRLSAATATGTGRQGAD